VDSRWTAPTTPESELSSPVTVTEASYLPPGHWPLPIIDSDEENSVAPPDSPRSWIMQIIGFFSGLASGIHTGLTSSINKIWRQQPHPDAATPPAPTPEAAGEPDGSPSPKRPRFVPNLQPSENIRRASGPFDPTRIQENARRGRWSHSTPQSYRRGGIMGQWGNLTPRQLPLRPAPQIIPLRNAEHTSPTGPGPDFNHAGHFSADLVVESDSDSIEDTPMPDAPDIGSPMDLDSPEPIALNQPEAILAQDVGTEENDEQRSQFRSEGPTPIALNQPEAILAVDPSEPIHVECRPATTSPTAAAAIRAINMISRNSARNFAAPRMSMAPPATPSAATIPVKPVIENHPQPSKDTLKFFAQDFKYSLPGLEGQRLTCDARKEKQIKRAEMEKLRAQQDRAQNEQLKKLGLRRPRSALIPEASQQWVARATEAPFNGKFDPSVHPAAVKLEARDFAKLVPETAWLNDDCVHATLCCLSAYVNEKAGVKPKQDAPKCVAMSSLNWTTFCGDNKKLYPRLFQRQWNMTPQNFDEVDTVLIPVNSGNHWTLLVIRPSRKSLAYIDSYNGASQRHLNQAREWLRVFLGSRYVAEQWHTEHVPAPRQHNAWDCGMFVVTNAMCLALGLDPMCYDETKMPTQRRRIAAMLLNGGFFGEFDLGHL